MAHPEDDRSVGEDQPDQAAAPEPEARSSSSLRTLVIGAVVALALVAGVAVLTTMDDPTGADAPVTVTGSGAPDGLALPDAVAELPPTELDAFGGEGTVPVSDYLGGQPLVINFWATWCGPCVAEMPDFQAVHEAGGDQFRLLGINTQDAEANAEPFVADLGITYDLAVDRMGEYFTETGSFGMPTTLFVEPDGTVAYRQTGPLSAGQMTALLDEHLGVEVTLPDEP